MPMIDIDWLKDHVEVPGGLTYEQLAKDLSRWVLRKRRFTPLR